MPIKTSRLCKNDEFEPGNAAQRKTATLVRVAVRILAEFSFGSLQNCGVCGGGVKLGERKAVENMDREKTL